MKKGFVIVGITSKAENELRKFVKAMAKYPKDWNLDAIVDEVINNEKNHFEMKSHESKTGRPEIYNFEGSDFVIEFFG